MNNMTDHSTQCPVKSNNKVVSDSIVSFTHYYFLFFLWGQEGVVPLLDPTFDFLFQFRGKNKKGTTANSLSLPLPLSFIESTHSIITPFTTDRQPEKDVNKLPHTIHSSAFSNLQPTISDDSYPSPILRYCAQQRQTATVIRYLVRGYETLSFFQHLKPHYFPKTTFLMSSRQR